MKGGIKLKFYFAKEDYDKLLANIENIRKRVKKIGQEMGASCQEGAETFHDNFAYEDGERQQIMLTKRYTELKRMLENSVVIEKTEQKDKAIFGNIVTYEDLDSEEKKTVEISSYMILREKRGNLISYNSPLGRLLLGAEEGEIKKGKIAGKIKKIEIINIS